MGGGVFRQTSKAPEDDQGGGIHSAIVQGDGFHSAIVKADPARSKA
jgi:hypothetical protein